MFKRVEKRLKRKQREDELGLDDDMKEVLGLNDTDSDESDSDDNSDDASAEDDLLGDEDDEDIELHDSEDGLISGMDGDEQEDDEGGDERALIAVSEALDNPIFIVSLDPDVKECIVCPGKLLKGTVMVDKHKSSNAHERRFKQFQKLAASANSKTSAQELVQTVIDERRPQTSTPSGTSKRAEKKHITQEKRRIKREKFKARQRAKKAALTKKEPGESKEKEPADSVKTARKDQRGKRVTGIIKEKSLVAKVKRKAKPSVLEATSSVPHSTTKFTKRDDDHPPVPPKKKRKTSITSPASTFTLSPDPTTLSTTKSTKSITSSTIKPKSRSSPVTEESPAVIHELQSQVKDIIKSASSLAKAARARALSGDGEGEEKTSSAKKRKPLSTKKKAQKS